MRYENADRVMQLALEMQAARQGLTLTDIEARFGVGRRTAMRMRDAVLRNFPQAEEVPGDDLQKRWRIPSGILNHLINFSAEELADLQTAIDVMRRENREDQAENLKSVAAKVKSLMKPEAARKTAPDLEALLEAEGLAMRPGPKPRIDVSVLQALRYAIKGGIKVSLVHRRRKDGKLKKWSVAPYGFLHGHRNYLVARTDEGKMLMFSLPNIESVSVLKDGFERDETFSLKDFAERSFGLFQDEPQAVVWRFKPEAAEVAGEFTFHPTQKTRLEEDGSLLVSFTACSDLEMAWHLYCWGDKVEVIEPASLVELVEGSWKTWQALP